MYPAQSPLASEQAAQLGALQADQARIATAATLRLDALSLALERIEAQFMSHTNVRSDGSQLPAVGFIRTQRTGGATIVNILHRLAGARQLSFMTSPGKNEELGWPTRFPGPDAAAVNGAPAHQYDLICSRAVFNFQEFRAYLKPQPFLFTVLRRPPAQIASSFATHRPKVGKDESWDARVAWLERLWFDQQGSELGKDWQRTQGLFRNPQAHDLGWYERVGGTVVFDQDDDAIQQWVGDIEEQLGLVMLQEHFDEGLVLLRRRLGLELPDLVHLSLNARPADDDDDQPSREQEEKIDELLHVDGLLYQHFTKRFWQQWDEAGGDKELGAELQQLRRLNIELQELCDGPDSDKCPEGLRWSPHDFALARPNHGSDGF